MPLTNTTEDQDAWKKVNGAFDDLSDGSAYFIEGMKTVDQGRNPMTKHRGLGKVAIRADIAQKSYSYGKKALELLDPKTRSGAIVKIGVDLAIDVVGKVLGASLSTHPYFVYHKAMIEYLAGALDANRNAREAISQYRKAVSAANSKAIDDEFKRLEGRKVEISAAYSSFKDTIGMASDIYHQRMTPAFAERKIAQYGARRLAGAMIDLQIWRMAWTGLAFESIKLQVMANNQMNAAHAAMQKVDELVKDLMKGNYLNKVNGYGARNHIEWEKYDLIVNQGKPQQSALDPVAFAQGKFEKAQAWCASITEMCDFARSSEVTFAGAYNKQLEKLNKVLYGG